MSWISLKVPLGTIFVSALLVLAISAWAYPADTSAAKANDTFDECAAAGIANQNASADCTKVPDCTNTDSQGGAFEPTKNCLTNLPRASADTANVRKGLQVVFGVAAGVSLISLSIAAFNFATAATDSEKISRSKKAIIFSLIGLVITLSAEAIVTTVLGKL